jgi:NTP pyrophosphatase (non-canonical NTP hydrolase)
MPELKWAMGVNGYIKHAELLKEEKKEIAAKLKPESWDQKSITEWAEKTFGYPSFKDLFNKTNDEYQELYDEVYETDKVNYDGVQKESADVVIMLFQLAEFIGFDLMEEVQKKMNVNVNRKWAKTGEGVGQHQ